MHKKTLRTILACLLIASFMTVPAFAESAKVNGHNVNLRSGPGMSYEILDCLAAGTTVTVSARVNTSWYAVDYRGTSGFMAAQYLSVNDNNVARIIMDKGPGRINAMGVGFYSAPDRSSSLLGEYNLGKEVTITGASGNWYAVTIDGLNGYVDQQYVSPDSGDGLVTPVTIPDLVTPEPVPAAAPPADLVTPEPAPAATPAPTPAPTATPAPAPAAVSVQGTPGTINGDYVCFRTGPSESNSIIANYNRGKELTVTGSSGDWYAVVIDGQAGYVHKSLVSTGSAPAAGTPAPAATPAPAPAATPAPAKSGEPGYITGNNVRLRSEPNGGGRLITELFWYDVVSITGAKGDWIAVDYKGESGYVYTQYVKKGDAEQARQQKQQADQAVQSGNAADVVSFALGFVGYKYVWGGISPDTGFDCSGFTSYVFKHYGVELHRVACDQAKNGRHVDPKDLKPGDILCFYSGSNYIGHVGIYIGNNQFVHAANSALGVIISDLSGYYSTRGYEARRVIG